MLLSHGRRRISHTLGTPVPKKSECLPSFVNLTNEADRSLDLPRHGAARALPLVVNGVDCGSVRRGRGGDQYSHRRRQGARLGSGHSRFFKGENRARWHVGDPLRGYVLLDLPLRKTRDRNDSPVLVYLIKQSNTHTPCPQSSGPDDGQNGPGQFLGSYVISRVLTTCLGRTLTLSLCLSQLLLTILFFVLFLEQPRLTQKPNGSTIIWKSPTSLRAISRF